MQHHTLEMAFGNHYELDVHKRLGQWAPLCAASWRNKLCSAPSDPHEWAWDEDPEVAP